MTHPHVTTATHRADADPGDQGRQHRPQGLADLLGLAGPAGDGRDPARLDSRTLHDIGLSRGEIESVVHGRRGDRRRCYDASWRGRAGAVRSPAHFPGKWPGAVPIPAAIGN